MKNISTLRYGALGLCAAASFSLAACSGGTSQSALGAPGLLPAGAKAGVPLSIMDSLRLTVRTGMVPMPHPSKNGRTLHGDLKIRPNKKIKGAAVLYASDEGSGVVDVYNWQDDQEALIGQVPGFQYPYGECSDKHGNVYVADYKASTISEIAYGTTDVVRVISDSAGAPIGCSVNPKTGDLAVTNFYDFNGSGGVLIYKNASGTPTQYSGPYYNWPAGYDPNGNLFVLGEAGNCTASVCLEELPNGGTQFYNVTMSGFTVNFPAAVQWDGKYLGVGDQEYDGEYVTGIYQVSVSGSDATAVASTGMSGTCYGTYNDMVQWAFDSKKSNDVLKKPAIQVVGGDLFCQQYFGVWSYPKSGINAPILVAQGTVIPVESYGQTLVEK